MFFKDLKIFDQQSNYNRGQEIKSIASSQQVRRLQHSQQEFSHQNTPLTPMPSPIQDHESPKSSSTSPSIIYGSSSTSSLTLTSSRQSSRTNSLSKGHPPLSPTSPDAIGDSDACISLSSLNSPSSNGKFNTLYSNLSQSQSNVENECDISLKNHRLPSPSKVGHSTISIQRNHSLRNQEGTSKNSLQLQQHQKNIADLQKQQGEEAKNMVDQVVGSILGNEET